MLVAIIYLLGFYLAGELMGHWLNLAVPGNVLGMMLLFVFLIVRGGVPKDLDEFVPKFLRPMVLYFIPSVVGVMTLAPLLANEGWAIVVAMVLSTLIPMWGLAYLLDCWLKKRALKTSGERDAR